MSEHIFKRDINFYLEKKFKNSLTTNDNFHNLLILGKEKSVKKYLLIVLSLSLINLILNIISYFIFKKKKIIMKYMNTIKALFQKKRITKFFWGISKRQTNKWT